MARPPWDRWNANFSRGLPTSTSGIFCEFLESHARPDGGVPSQGQSRGALGVPAWPGLGRQHEGQAHGAGAANARHAQKLLARPGIRATRPGSRQGRPQTQGAPHSRRHGRAPAAWAWAAVCHMSTGHHRQGEVSSTAPELDPAGHHGTPRQPPPHPGLSQKLPGSGQRGASSCQGCVCQRREGPGPAARGSPPVL